MSADSLYDNIRGYLRLSTRVVSKVGSVINVGEKFKIRFTGANIAYAANLVGAPRIIFKNPRVCIWGTAYAKPVGGNKWYNLPDKLLYPGESSYVDVEFQALKDILGPDTYVNEHVAKAWILGDLDQEKFFQIWNYKNVYEEIDPT